MAPVLDQLRRAKPVDTVYLDTTYADEQYVFPSQKDIISKALKVMWSEFVLPDRDTLFVFGSYTIGKERIYMGNVLFSVFCACVRLL
jgi:hypothetical protein